MGDLIVAAILFVASGISVGYIIWDCRERRP